MFKAIEITNFLSHKRTRLELSDGVNVIVGATDSGKSAIVRALRWLVWNRPAGEDFRSYWGGATSVTALMPEVSVTRFKDSKTNKYVLHTDGRTRSEEFKALGVGVPAEVEAALNVDKINFQTQFEPHFLLGKSPGEIAQHFNSIAYLDKIDVGLRNIQSWIRDLQMAIKTDEGQLQCLQEDLAQYEDIGVIEGKVVYLEELDVMIAQIEENVDNINHLRSEVVDLTEKIASESYILNAAPLVDQLLDWTNDLHQLEGRRDELGGLCFEAESTRSEIEKIQQVLPAEKLIDSLLDMDKEISELTDARDKLDGCVVYWRQTHKTVQGIERELIEMEKQFHKQMGDVCPLCGQKITKAK